MVEQFGFSWAFLHVYTVEYTCIHGSSAGSVGVFWVLLGFGIEQFEPSDSNSHLGAEYAEQTLVMLRLFRGSYTRLSSALMRFSQLSHFIQIQNPTDCRRNRLQGCMPQMQ